MNIKGKIFLTLFTGVLFGLPAYLILSLIDDKTAALLGVLAGALFSLFMLTFLFIYIYEKAMNKRAAEAEKRFESEILYKTSGKMFTDEKMTASKSVYMNFYVLESGLALMDLEHRKAAVKEISGDEISAISPEGIALKIETADGRIFSFVIPDRDGVLEFLKERGWRVT
ncbi:MAG: hypothetical protein K5647_03305 [Clostridiales bacterium]|nr:hypothetical protein [Clostridiales bacterium]